MDKNKFHHRQNTADFNYVDTAVFSREYFAHLIQAWKFFIMNGSLNWFLMSCLLVPHLFWAVKSLIKTQNISPKLSCSILQILNWIRREEITWYLLLPQNHQPYVVPVTQVAVHARVQALRRVFLLICTGLIKASSLFSL